MIALDPAESPRVLDQGFGTILEGHLTAYPFACRDFLGRSHLQFSVEEPDQNACRPIDGAFWRLFLRALDDREDFEVQVNAPLREDNIERWVDRESGCKFGHIYRDESLEPERLPPQAGHRIEGSVSYSLQDLPNPPPDHDVVSRLHHPDADHQRIS